jgi:hypothetical protein
MGWKKLAKGGQLRLSLQVWSKRARLQDDGRQTFGRDSEIDWRMILSSSSYEVKMELT